jgi:hypothetical protein
MRRNSGADDPPADDQQIETTPGELFDRASPI